MNILWLEDFPTDGSPASQLTEALFGSLLGGEDAVDIHEDRLEAAGGPQAAIDELLDQQGGFHSIRVCRSYGDVAPLLRTGKLNVDLAVLDVNLTAYRDPADRPEGFEGVDDFEERAGFYVYNQLVRLGMLDANVAFLTAYDDRMATFQRECAANLIDPPRNVFVKGERGFGAFRTWLDERLADPYLVLRAGVLDGIADARAFVDDEGRREDDFLFYWAVPPEHRPESLDEMRAHTHSVLDRIEAILPHRPPADPTTRLDLFAKELAAEWEAVERSRFHRLRNQLGGSEGQVAVACQSLLKRLRNWTAHGQVQGLTEADAALYFACAMRGWLRLPLELGPYEESLASLLTGGPGRGNVKREVARTYHAMRERCDGESGGSRSDFFGALLDAWAYNNRSGVSNEAPSLLRQSLWHEIIPSFSTVARYQEERASVAMFLNPGGHQVTLVEEAEGKSFLALVRDRVPLP